MTTSTSRTRIRIPKSCLQCRRRHQRCIPSLEGACQNCLRRYPPVECIGLPSTKNREWSISTLPARDRPAFQPSPPDSGGRLPLSLEKRKVIAETPRIFGGILTEMTTLNGMPIESTLRIAELAHLFNQYVVPNYVSIDGQNLPALFKTNILPWMIQSPLMPNIAILMASYSERLERGIEGCGSDRETLVIKNHVLGLVQRFLEHDFAGIADEAIRAVTHLVISEWWWGSEQSLWAHMKGIREMVRILGGLGNLPDPTLTNVLMLTDIELSCCYERPLFFAHPISPPPSPTSPAPSISTYLSSPLYPSTSTFRETAPLLQITPLAADILDDIRFLTLSITSPTSTASTAKIKSTAKWLHDRHSNLPQSSTGSSPSTEFSPGPTTNPSRSADEEEGNGAAAAMVEDTIRRAALIYTCSIATCTPFRTPSQSSRANIARVKQGIRRVGMKRWKEIPGIFLWILIVICPGLDPPRQRDSLDSVWGQEKTGRDGEKEGYVGEGSPSSVEGVSTPRISVGEVSEAEDRENRGLRKRMAVTGMAIGLEGFGLGIEFLRAAFEVQRWLARAREDGEDDLGL